MSLMKNNVYYAYVFNVSSVVILCMVVQSVSRLLPLLMLTIDNYAYLFGNSQDCLWYSLPH